LSGQAFHRLWFPLLSKRPEVIPAFFVENPVKLDISGKPKIDEIKIPVHPDRPEEKRKIEIGKDIFISSGDMKEFKGC